MSYFYGYLTGNRGATTRGGSKASGINAHLRSWVNDVHVWLYDNDGKDELKIDVPKGLTVIINGKKRRF